MTWKNKIKLGMDMIAEGCKENRDWTKCRECPFNDYCTVLLETLNDDERDEIGDMNELFGNEVND